MKQALTGVILASQIGDAVYRRTADKAAAKRVHAHIVSTLGANSIYNQSDLWLLTVAEWMEAANV